MLYFSKIKLFIIYFTIIILTLCFSLNFFNNDDNYILSKKVNLGLDLQGGSYLLLEVDSTPVINQKLQSKLLVFKKHLKKNVIKYQNLKLQDQSINFLIKNDDIKKFRDLFSNDDNPINSYYNNYRSYEMEYEIENNLVKIKFTKFGLIELKNTTLEQSL